MAMKRCPVCGEKYSDTYKNCPFCEEEEYWEEDQEVRRPILREGGRSSSRRSPYSIVTTVDLIAAVIPPVLPADSTPRKPSTRRQMGLRIP